METARNLVALPLELPARVKRGEDQLESGLLVLRVGVDWNAASVVGYRGATMVGVQHDLDARRISVDCFVDRVVDDLPQEMVVAVRVGPADVHRGPLANRLQPFENVDVFGGVRH